MTKSIDAGGLAGRGARGAPLPYPLPEPPGVPEPRDEPYPGVMTLQVDVTDVERRIFRVRQTIPVSHPDHATLIFPKWLPGFHAPQAPIELFATMLLVPPTMLMFVLYLAPGCVVTTLPVKVLFRMVNWPLT